MKQLAVLLVLQLLGVRLVCSEVVPSKIWEGEEEKLLTSSAATSKHGRAEVPDICTGKKYEDICTSTNNMDVPFGEREDYALTDISDDGYLTLMTEDNGVLREDVKLPDGDLGIQLRMEFENGRKIRCTVLKACGVECVIAYKIVPSLVIISATD